MISDRLKSFAKDRTVLLVDDDQSILHLFQRIFSRVFKEIHLAEDGEEGVEIFRQRQPDLIVSDIVMPNMDGLKMTELIRAEKRGVKIIIITAHDDQQNLEILENREIPFLVKPVDREDLWEMIEKVMMGESDS